MLKLTNGILLIYNHRLTKNASTLMEHINSFSDHSQFKVWAVNTELGFPHELNNLQFQVILLHYSLFGNYLSKSFQAYLKQSEASYKIAFFQDEHHTCQKRFEFINRFAIDCIYTLLEPAYFKDVYQKYTTAPKLVSNIPGYVSDSMILKAQKFAKTDDARNIDIGYRCRQLSFYMGKGSQEKHEIGVRFLASESGLKLDIKTTEAFRLYGDEWYKFLGNCKGCLGVEAGASIFDIEDYVKTEHDRLLSENPKLTFEDMSNRLLKPWEENIPYRTISPRHFEAAAFRICQILYESEYSGIMKPMVHYIPLKKDFSNFNEVIHLFNDKHLRQQITENCYRDLIASGKYNYETFINGFDQDLIALGFTPRITQDEIETVSKALSSTMFHKAYRQFTGVRKIPYYGNYPGKKVLLHLLRPIYEMFNR